MRVAMDCRPHGFVCWRGFNDLRRKESEDGFTKKELGASGIDSRGAYMQHAGLIFCALRDSFPSGNQELYSGGVYHTLEGNR